MLTSRRSLLLSPLLGLLSGATSRAQPMQTSVPGPPRAGRPIIIAHRGASGQRPEHSRSAYELAIDQGCDYIEPDLVLSKDGHLLVRHENEIGSTTDIGSRPAFASRQTTRTIDGEAITGWFSEDFTLAELKTLRCRERLPELRPASAGFDGKDPILTFDEVVAIARSGTRRTGRVIGVYPEMKHPTHFASVGLKMEPVLADALKRLDLASRTSPVLVQCFEVRPLKALARLVDVHLIQLVDGQGGPADLPGARYADMLTPMGLRVIAGYATGIGPHHALVTDFGEEGTARATRLVGFAHAVGLAVHAWTVRAENRFLPAVLQVGDPALPGHAAARGQVEALYQALFDAGVDGLFTDFPAIGVKARAKAGLA